MQAIKLDQINVTKRLTEDQLDQIKNQLDLLVEEDFEINEGPYYCYSAHGVATIYIELDGEEAEFRLSYPISDNCFEGDDLIETNAQAEAYERFCLDIIDCNDIILD